MSDTSRRIAEVLDNRRRLLPAVDDEILRWEQTQQLLVRLGQAIDAVGAAQDESLAALGLNTVDVPALRQRVSEVLAALAAVRARVGRHTMNIGVSGRARNGKSTLLQSLTGLGDDQIPAGAGVPVTAVRSRIFHSAERREAVLTMHTEASFCAEVLAGYHEELRLGPPPETIAAFVAHDYPAHKEDLDLPAAEQTRLGPMLVRLREMQNSTETYRQFLNGQTRVIEFADLRAWVAYPGIDDPRPDRRYLAVRDARITTRFPTATVEDLGLIDLPGLGESMPNAERHHIAGLENDVDFVLNVKRPDGVNAYWDSHDAAGLGLICQAAGAAPVRDFAAILVNSGGLPQENVDALLSAIRDGVNENAREAAFPVIVADVKSPETVQADVLGPVLAHLATALPRMDTAVIEHALTLGTATREHLGAVAADLLATLRSVLTPTTVDLLLARAKGLQQQMAGTVQEWIAGLEEKAADSYEDKEFYDRAQQLRDDVRDWIVDGFGEGEPAWRQRAVSDMRVDDSPSPFTVRELNAVRVEIARRFGAIDDLLERRREEFWAGLAEALGARLVPPADGGPRQALADLAVRLREAPDPCPVLAEAVDHVLDVRLDYRTRVMPRMRTALSLLRSERSQPPAVPHNDEGAGTLFTHISHLAREAAHGAAKTLEQEPAITAQVLLAFAEQFEDQFIRSAKSEAEFRRLAEAFRDQLWPDELSGPALATARVQHLRSVLRDLTTALQPSSDDGTSR
ncbi:hypothetical protein [Paractinoplanes lichenicola]|uniref:Dynamin family protein n=1 Tax=Paractinoplanes lichenicola TaxID=2802976 RepID=A0ABS1VM79_9ACTN|nr:hypothetical protein [Actinoplanes lichenicola]MBL7255832.1 hypothetical protein [Actinoplanes lichenicola]